MSITAAGNTLTPFFVFKAKTHGRLSKQYAKHQSEHHIIAFQEGAWMNEELMLCWIDTVLKPWALSAPPRIVPVVFLDAFKGHLLPSVMRAIENEGVEVKYIPANCTGLTQPVDVGYNKPLKQRVRNKWEDWIISDGLNDDGTCSCPMHGQVINWVISLQSEIH